jgi:multidrug efflux pump subunit AcrB
MWLTLLALRNRIGILMLSLAMVVLGATSLNRLPVDLFPNIQVPVAFVGVIYKGAPPLDIEQSVVYPIEKAVSSASNVEHVESFAKQGIGAVQIWFNWGADINVGQMEVMQRITQILNSLPPGILQPFIVKFDVSNIPVSFVTVSSDDLDERALYDLAFNTIAPQIEQIANVAAATVEGGKIRQININLDPALLNARGLSILDVVKAVKAANLILPSGDIKAGNLDYNVFTNNQFRTVEPIQDVIVKVNQQGNPVRVRDLATVTDSSDIQTNVVRTDGKRAVYLRVNKQPIANTVEVVDALRAALPKMIGIPPGVKLGISFDQSVYIRQSIGNLVEQALHGSLLAAAVILVFLRSLTSTVIISVAIPLSIMVTFIVLYFAGQTLNVFTLGGFRPAGRRLDRGIGEYPAASQYKPPALGCHSRRRQGSRYADFCFDRNDRRRIFADIFCRWHCPAVVDSVDRHHCHCPVHVLLRVPHGHASLVLQIPETRRRSPPLDAALVRPCDGVEPASL